MKLLIEIPEEVYKKAKETHDVMCDSVWLGIKHGTPLPKGHGRLIDTNEITAFRELECNGRNVESLDEFTTIIEADKGVEE